MNQLTKINSFTQAVQRGIESFEEAGRILVDLLDQDGTVKQKILDQNPGFTIDLLNTFERIGRKQLYYKLCINENPGIRALRRCTYSDQVKYFDGHVELLIFKDKKPETLQVSIHALTAEQTKQVFKSNRIRSPGEQRVWLEAQKQKPIPLNMGAPYTVFRGKVTFHKPCILTVADLAQLLAEATGH